VFAAFVVPVVVAAVLVAIAVSVVCTAIRLIGGMVINFAVFFASLRAWSQWRRARRDTL